MAKNTNSSLESKLWKAADKLRKNIDAAEYKHVVLGLIFLRYISEAFEDLQAKLMSGEGEYEFADPEDRDEYIGEGIFYVPEEARWSYLLARAKHPDIGVLVDNAMELIEKENPMLKGVLPKVYSRSNLDPINLGGLIDLFSDISFKDGNLGDVFGHVFEYFLGQFALAEGKKGGQFYTPRSVVELLVEMVEPFFGRVYDPCCGSGGMFVHSDKFVTAHQGRKGDIAIYGQESNMTTWRLCKMNLAVRAIDSTQVVWNNEGSFLRDAFPNLKVQYILANPPFNDSDWGENMLRSDPRWKYGLPPASNANYAWIQHFIYHLADNGVAGFIMANGSLSAKGTEGDIRRRIIEDGLVDCIVSLQAKLFMNTSIPVSAWILRKNKKNRQGEILFIDARNMGYDVNRSLRALSDEDIKKIADTYHSWRKLDGSYKDIKGFCKSATLNEVKQHDYVLVPSNYVGLPEYDDEFNFKERFMSLQVEWEEQLKEEAQLNNIITENLKRVKIDE